MRIVKRVVAGLAVLAALALVAGLVAALGAWLWLRSGLPERSGEIALAGLEAPVTVRSGPHAIPVIEAGSDADAYRALGFLHARDRLWQMDTQRLAGAGRLAEIAGEALLPRDRFMRRIGVYDAAERSFANLEPGTRAALEAYAAGVNAHLESREGPLPIEFQIVGREPEPWRPADSLVWNWLISLQLSGNQRDELRRAALLQRHPAEDVADLYPDLAWLPPARLHPDLEGLDFTRLLDPLPPPPMEPGSASNQWAVAGDRTQSGAPVLANDPHLQLGAPILWYLARIETPTLSVSGATVPGVPFHVIGHNRDIAWGVTATGSDLQDLFVERIDPDDPNRYLTPEGSAAFETRRETIRVSDGAPEELVVRTTRHGPVLLECGPDVEPACVVALAFGDLGPNRTADGLARLNRAGGREDFLAAMRLLRASQINVGYADRDGSIGFYAPGRVPMRRAGHGRTPKPGWTGAFDWTGFVPFEELPHAFDPAGGIFLNANQPLVGEDYPHLLTSSFEPSFRADRIAEALAADETHGVEDAAALQADAVSLAARAVVPVLLAAEPTSEAARDLLARLQGWDFRFDRARPEPLIYSVVLHTLARRLLADELGALAGEYGEPDPRVVLRILEREAPWCDDVSSEPAETCAEILSGALEEASSALRETHGDDPDAWAWGDAHVAPLRHPVIARIPVLGRLLDIATPLDGGDHTVLRATSMAWPEPGFEAVHGAGLRAVFDLSDLERSRFVIATGQSGDPLSPHYGDQVDAWRDGRHLVIGGAEATDVLRLTPARDGGP